MANRITVKPGDIFGRLKIVSEAPMQKNKRYFNCICECGNHRTVRFVSLRSGDIKSCGCLRNQQNATAALSHGMSKSSLYNSWHSMKQRCLNQNDKNFNHYGGRGISICNEWLEFDGFKEWANANGYSDGLSIERNDVDGNYEPNNCRWATQHEQLRNTRRTVLIEYNGMKMCVTDWAAKLGISKASMQKRLKRWPIEKALSGQKTSGNEA